MQDMPSRLVFIELCEGVFRTLGFDPPPMLHDDAVPLAMELQVDSRDFELIHSPTDRSEQVLILCKLDTLTQELDRTEYEAMLASNLENIRLCQPYFGINSDTQEIVWISNQKLSNTSPGLLLENLGAIAFQATGWRDNLKRFYVEDDSVNDVQGVILA